MDKVGGQAEQDWTPWLTGEAFDIHFQPIVDVAAQRVVAHEALMRPRAEAGFAHPAAVFEAAQREGCLPALDVACLALALQRFAAQRLSSQLYVNLRAATLLNEAARERLFGLLARTRQVLGKGRLVLELTEADPLTEKTVEALQRLCQREGVHMALDDFGYAHSNLDAWLTYRPEVVKIDRRFVHGIDTDPTRQRLVMGLKVMAEATGARLLGECVERAEQFHLLRSLGVELIQGYWVGWPQAQASVELPEAVREALSEQKIAVVAEPQRPRDHSGALRPLIRPAPMVAQDISCRDALRAFAQHADAPTLVLGEAGRKPVAILTRSVFMNEMALPYRMELYRRQPARRFANTAPVLVQADAPLDQLAEVLTLQDQRYLTDGVVVLEHGRYLGVCPAHALIRLVTENRIAAARHANPLTLLPGNVPIQQHIQRLLQARLPFALAYADLNHFKPFNDRYGFWKGDEVIARAAQGIAAHMDRLHDFLGHVGGDDFVLIFQSEDWLERLQRIRADVNARIAQLYPEADRLAGGIEAEDRFGVTRFFPLVSVSFGVVLVDGHEDVHLDALTTQVAEAKRASKSEADAICVQPYQASPPSPAVAGAEHQPEATPAAASDTASDTAPDARPEAAPDAAPDAAAAPAAAPAARCAPTGAP